VMIYGDDFQSAFSAIKYWIFHSKVYHLFHSIVYHRFTPKFTTRRSV
jgi:hypothetical protein